MSTWKPHTFPNIHWQCTADTERLPYDDTTVSPCKSSRSCTFLRRDNWFLINHRVYCVTSCAYCSSGDSVARDFACFFTKVISGTGSLSMCRQRKKKLIIEHWQISLAWTNTLNFSVTTFQSIYSSHPMWNLLPRCNAPLLLNRMPSCITISNNRLVSTL